MFDPKIVNTSKAYLIKMHFKPIIDNIYPNETIAIEVGIVNTTYRKHEIQKLQIQFGSLDDGVYQWIEFPLVESSEYGMIYITNDLLKELHFDCLSFQEQEKPDPIDPDVPSDREEDNKKILSGGEIAGIIIGVIIAVCLIIAAIFVIRMRARYNSDSAAVVGMSI